MVNAFVASWRRIAGRLYFVGGMAILAVVALAAASIYFAYVTSQATHKLFDDGLVGVVDATETEILLEKHRRIVETAPTQYSRNQIVCAVTTSTWSRVNHTWRFRVFSNGTSALGGSREGRLE